MGYEVDFLPVGSGECSGDAIALRHGNLSGNRSEQRVFVIDGGYMDSGKSLVEHIKTYYKTDSVDVVVSTHPDDDHSSGLAVVLEEMKVGTLLMHKPWEHTDDIARMFRDGRVTDDSVSVALRRSLDSARDLERIASRKGIRIVEPFAGTQGWNSEFLVVGPTVEYYESLLCDFRCTPEPVERTLSQRILESLKEQARAVAETWNIETLDDDGVTSAENNSSAIVLIRPEAGRALLFTADAGIPALTSAADYVDSFGFDYDTIGFIQVPHHGSRRNVGPTILNRLLGPIKAADAKLRTAFVSAGKDAAKHPARRVTNAFRRRGAPVFGTMGGSSIHHQLNAPAREGWVSIEPVPFYRDVDDTLEAA